MYLYGDVYALEANNSHICICAKCAHGSYFDINRLKNMKIVRFKYPRSSSDIIDEEDSDMSDEMKELMKALLNEDSFISLTEILLEKFKGMINITRILMKTDPVPANKRLFKYANKL